MEDQAEMAKGAIKNTALEMAKNLVKTFKVQDWAKEYPIKTTSVAAVIGFFVGEKVTEAYEESQHPDLEVENKPVKPEEPVAKVPSGPPKPSAFSQLSSLLITKGADLLKDLAYTWYVQEVLPKLKKEKEEEEPSEGDTEY